MVKYTLNVTIDNKWVKYFNKNNWKFCFARNAQSVGSDTTFNVIAYADEVAENVTVTWEDKYGMAGAKTGYSAGAKIQITTNVEEIDFGQCFTLKDWADYSVAKDKAAPQYGFLFRTTPSAAAVLYEEVNDKQVAVYITPEDILPPNTSESLTPKVSVAIWFQRKVESNTMVDEAITQAFVIAMTTTTVSVDYTANGEWVMKTGKVHYLSKEEMKALEEGK